MSISEQTQELLHTFVSSQTSEVQNDIKNSFAEMLATEISDKTLITGNKVANFSLPNALGHQVTLSEALNKGPVVLSFYRGGWCPYCNIEFAALNNILPQIKELGASLIGVSPETPDSTISTVEKHDLQFEVLSDSGNTIAEQFGLVLSVPSVMRPHYLSWGIDVPAANGDESYDLPIPATYVIDTTGTITAHFVNKDYTQRMEPEDIIAALKTIV
ncbi:AhpC/Tsa family protein GSU0066 [hydrothermal vent metagenome]|uniref:thioredoxin-dependent peroxiredoxin n=1 Tax=hydrothermal vent metagenome TaxID=652676 RepID=A0A3B0YK82_9ZZZZ